MATAVPVCLVGWLVGYLVRNETIIAQRHDGRSPRGQGREMEAYNIITPRRRTEPGFSRDIHDSGFV